MASWYDNVPTPVDANGRKVPLDTKRLVYKGETRGVTGIAYLATSGMWTVIFDNAVVCPYLTQCSLPDSWERLEEDVRGARDVKWSLASCRHFGYDTAESCVDCPARGDGKCESAAFDDILRRAKELVGVTDDE